MLIVTTDSLNGKEIEELGLVKGSTVMSKHIGKDIMAGVRNLVGGEVAGYVEMMNEARDIATNRMIDEAKALGADAIVAARYASSSIMQSAAEVIAYGTAVSFK